MTTPTVSLSQQMLRRRPVVGAAVAHGADDHLKRTIGTFQLTMFGVGLRSGGERFGALAWFGFVLAAGGLVYLVFPGVAAPPLLGAGLMAVAGGAWGGDSLGGRGGGGCLVDDVLRHGGCRHPAVSDATRRAGPSDPSAG